MKLVMLYDDEVVSAVIEDVTEIREEDGTLYWTDINEYHARCSDNPLRYVVVSDEMDIRKGFRNPDPVQLLNIYKQRKINEIKEACKKDILNGFISPTTGHHYAFSETDQLNFAMQLTLLSSGNGKNSTLWKTEDSGIVAHSLEALHAICKESEDFKRGKLEKCWQLQNKVEGCITTQEVEQVVW
ncbi:hypothetical protein IC620_09445 [Hazenella sp. IB182357]|uniref:DUF4376 domain-containing protein n=1 Tax=Polycladospora coralii TaxID=2771432 RepID=A0A926N9Y8_9BACL|nr:hypothetical protein [Polycladospora coralii]MBD1372577.1 hypothetical protein [Polycladospora coralii]